MRVFGEVVGRVKVYTPSTVAEALEVRRSVETSFFLGGGTLINGSRWRRSGELIDLSRLKLAGVEEHQGGRLIGATTTLTRIAESPLMKTEPWCFLSQAIMELQRINVRNAATIGGVIGANQTFSDVIPALFCLDTSIEYQAGPESEPQRQSLSEYLARRPAERPLILRVILPSPKEPARFGSARHARNAGDIPCAKVAVRLEDRDGVPHVARLAVCASGRTARLISQAEGPVVDRSTLASLIADEVRPVGDIRGSASFKVQIVKTLVKDALRDALGEDGEGR